MVVLTNYGYAGKFLKDGFNRNRGRRQNNTAYRSYNCGGFALGVFSWYAPYNEDILDYAVDNGIISKEAKEGILAELSEEEYEIDVEDFLNDWKEYSNEVPKNAMHTIPTYESWKNIKIIDGLEYYYGDVFSGNSPFTEYFIDCMLKEIAGLRVINSVDDLKENEYCIAFRTGHGDFHYVRSNNNNCKVWVGKMGDRPVEELTASTVGTIYNEKFFDELFNGGRRYNSDTILFAKVA